MIHTIMTITMMFILHEVKPKVSGRSISEEVFPPLASSGINDKEKIGGPLSGGRPKTLVF